MRKYGKVLLVLAVCTAVPPFAGADGFLRGLRPQSASGLSQNQQRAEQVKQALQEAQIQGQDIRIEVVDGVVRLTGKVTVPGHRAKAGQACERIPGITRVNNELVYVPENGIQPTAAVDSSHGVQAAAYHSAAAAVPQQTASGIDNQKTAERVGAALCQAGLQNCDISVHVLKGVATISGSVHHPEQRRAAEAAARQVEGIRQVVNELTVAAAPMPPAAPRTAAYPQSTGQHPSQPVSFAQAAPPVLPANAMPAQAAMPVSAGAPMAMGGAGFLSHPHLPAHAWPAYAQYPNSAAVTYPTQYSASAFPYIGPFYPYPQVPLGWRDVRLQWDDGFWHLNFNKKPSVWATLFNPKGRD